MTRYAIFADIAGQVTLDTSGGPRVTCAAIALESSMVENVLSHLPNALPKWRSSSEETAARIFDLLASRSSAVGVVSVDRNTRAWGKFWQDVKPLHDAIVAQDRLVAGFVKPANIVKFYLHGTASAIALGQAVLRNGPGNLLDRQGRHLIERTVVCDSDLQGEESIELFKSFWRRHDQRQPLVNNLGIQIVTHSVRLVTEQQEPLLLLADYAAGVLHAASSDSEGRVRFPISRTAAQELESRLVQSGKLAKQDLLFDFTYDEIFGLMMDRVRNRHGKNG